MSKFLALFAFFVTLYVSSFAVPTNLNTVSRQEDFVMAPAPAEPASPVTEPAAAPATTVETNEMVETEETVDTADTIETIETDPVAMAPVVSAEPSAVVGDVAEIAYNIGGGAFGKFEADPVDWIIGETAAFEIPEAMIGGAEPQNADAYKSHRYGLVGSTWGYDFAVETPGIYDCTLHYAETYSEFFTDEPNRTFVVNISGDGAPAVIQSAEFDVMVELEGAEFTAYTRTFTGISVATTLVLRQIPTIGDAFLSGVTCVYTGPLM